MTVENSTQEIERKFLVLNDSWRSSVSESSNLKQVYVCQQNDGWLTRLRIVDGKDAEITIKGPKEGISGAEYNLPMNIDAANDLWEKSKGTRLEKTRHIVKNKDGTKWEIDEFQGEGLKGLVFAEIELPNSDFIIEQPLWLGLEVSETRLYSNDFLASAYSNIEDYVPNLSNPTYLKDLLKILKVSGVDEVKMDNAFYQNSHNKEMTFGSSFGETKKVFGNNEFLDIFKNSGIDFSGTGMSLRKLRLIEDILDHGNGLPGDYSSRLTDYHKRCMKEARQKGLKP